MLDTKDFKRSAEILDLVTSFENCSLAPEEVDHRTLVIIGFWYLYFTPYQEAEAAMHLSLLRYRFHFGTGSPDPAGWMSDRFDRLYGTIERLRTTSSFIELANLVAQQHGQQIDEPADGSGMQQQKQARSVGRFSLTAAVAVLLAMVLVSPGSSQSSGGAFTVTKSSIAGGGGRLDGGQFSLDGTIGQSAAGRKPTGGNSAAEIGFWTSESFEPTAAAVTISGRVTTSNGRGITNVRITLTDASGATRIATTGTFGYYSFMEVTAGESYIVTATAKRFSFDTPTRLISVEDEITDLNFVAVGQ